MARLATYVIPDSSTPLYQLGSAIIGWDIFAERDITVPAELKVVAANLPGWVGPARAFGFHATVGDALDYPQQSESVIEQHLALIASQTTPFVLTNGRIHTSFRSVPRCLAATFTSPNRTVSQLEERDVTSINVLHEGSPWFGDFQEHFNPLQGEQFRLFGSPNVRSLFDLHFTLASAIPDAETWHRLYNLICNDLGLLGSEDQRTIAVDRIHLVEERADGRYRVRRSFPLTGTVKGSGIV